MGDNLPTPLRLAMWCGPRNISTALMRAWGNRPDTFVVDEPLYAHYLRETGLPHAMATEIIERYEADWEKSPPGSPARFRMANRFFTKNRCATTCCRASDATGLTR